MYDYDMVVIGSGPSGRRVAQRSNHVSCRAMDCFEEPVIGRGCAPTRWLAMTI
jgi:pyruvate/2-oxoglutarate dehydrogenase complex dihydrolipoamide dehydrogenase (E3) component